MKPLSFPLLLALSSLFLSAALGAPKEKTTRTPRLPEDLKIIDNIVFKEAGGKKLDLLLIQPQEEKFEKAPLVVYIHGGGWGKGDKYKVLRQDVLGVIRSLSHQGIACASIEYRLVDGKPTTANDAVADCLDAVRFLARHASEYGLDPDRIGTFGSSAGGHLTLVTALGQEADYPCDPSIPGPPVQVRCVASYYPLVSFVDRELMKGSNFERPQRLLPLLGGPLEEKRDLALKLSPIELLRPGSPPIFVAHGDADVVLHHSNALALRDAATAKGIPIECLISKGAGHGFSGDNIQPPLAEIQSRTVAFFLRHLK
jgi:acetyl esterase/lipase